MAGRWAGTALRWLELDFSLPTQFSYLLPRWNSPSVWLPDLYFSVVDNLLWSIVVALESVAVVTTLCFFFLFCGCTI
uniref:Uncharacterized protein n=1 Tax=Kalanchoe fedtschenkoi TaxID=63787 RepID=A0A7N0UAL5_KALFE